MKQVVCMVIMMTAAITTYAQKTTRLNVSDFRGITITGSATEKDTLFMMFGQNAKYTSITDLITVKHGRLSDITDFLVECQKFLPEPDGTSLDYKGNTILSMGKGQLMVFGTGRDSRGYIKMNKQIIDRLQKDITAFGN